MLRLTGHLFGAGLGEVGILQVPAALLLVQLALYAWIDRREARRPEQALRAREPLAAGGGFALVLSSDYLRLMVLLNVLGVLIQALFVSRIVKYLGLVGVLLALPLVSFGAYGLIAAGAGSPPSAGPRPPRTPQTTLTLR